MTNEPPPDPEYVGSPSGSFFTIGAIVRSLVLSLMDTADRVAEWLEGMGGADG